MDIFGVRVGSLRGKKVAILAADGFEYVELALPRAALRLARAQVRIVSVHSGRIRGMNLTEPTRTVRVHKTLEHADAAEFDALLIPGGFIGPDFLRQSQLARSFVRAFQEQGKPIATLCHGPWLLASADLVKGRRLASWPGTRDDIVHAGGIWRDEPVVRDANWVTSRGPQDLAAFIPAMVSLFRGDPQTPREDGSEQGSSPAYDSPQSATMRAVRLMPGPAVLTLVSAVLGTSLVGALARRMTG